MEQCQSQKSNSQMIKSLGIMEKTYLSFCNGMLLKPSSQVFNNMSH